MSATGIGASVRRKEDQRFTGKGHYTDDINRPGQAAIYFIPLAPRPRQDQEIDTAAAAKMPGVAACVFTGEQFAQDKLGNPICGWTVLSKDGSPMKMAPHAALAAGKANYVGDAVAVVIADTLAQAKDAAEKVVVDYEPLPAVVDPTKAAQKRAHRSFTTGAPGTKSTYNWHLGASSRGRRRVQGGQARHQDRPRQQPAGAERHRAARRARRPNTIPAQRPPHPVEREAQNPHRRRGPVPSPTSVGAGARALGCSVVAPDVGGGFRLEDIHLSRGGRLSVGGPRKRRPAGEVGLHERPERSIADAHGRDHVTTPQMAFDADGKITRA